MTRNRCGAPGVRCAVPGSFPAASVSAPPPSIPVSHRTRDAWNIVAVLAVKYALRRLLLALGVGFLAGQLSLVATLVFASWLLRRNGESWRALGLRRPASIPAALGWAFGAAIVIVAVLPLFLEPVVTALGWPPQHTERLGDLRNTWWFLLMLLPAAWGSAAFGEEMLYRGFFNTRLARLLGDGRAARVAGAIGQALLFGLAHWYLGPRGVLNTFAIGLTSSAVYALNGRNLWPLIIAHGLVDTIGLTALRLGVGSH